MTRTHIHKYETRYHAKATYSKAIRARGDLVVMQGQVAGLSHATADFAGGGQMDGDSRRSGRISRLRDRPRGGAGAVSGPG